MNQLFRLIDSRLKTSPDPLKIRQTTAEVVKNSPLVTIDLDRLNLLADKLKRFIDKKQLLTSVQFGHHQVGPQKVFLLDSVNFCFWTPKDKPQWQVEYPPGTISSGWKALVACFDRALEEKMPLLDSEFIHRLTLAQSRQLFRGVKGTMIPLLHKRRQNLRQVGSIDDLITAAKGNAVGIAQLVLKTYPHFQDTATYKNQRINFYKRAQILAYDLSLLSGQKIKELESLTVFADYRLPQLLRSEKVLGYQLNLAQMIDRQQLIDAGSEAEVAIRAATIWSGELLAHRLKLMPVVVDNALWSLAKKFPPRKPHHRTLTTSY